MWIFLAQQNVPIPNPVADQMAKDGQWLGYAFVTVLSLLVGVVWFLIRSIQSKDDLHRKIMEDMRVDNKDVRDAFIRSIESLQREINVTSNAIQQSLLNLANGHSNVEREVRILGDKIERIIPRQKDA